MIQKISLLVGLFFLHFSASAVDRVVQEFGGAGTFGSITAAVNAASDGVVSEECRGPVECVATLCYFLCALLLFACAWMHQGGSESFTGCLVALVGYEVLIGIFLPCESAMRSLYFPETARASVMTLPSVIVNLGVAVGVVSTNFIRYVEFRRSAF